MRTSSSPAFLLLAVLLLAGCGATSVSTPTPAPTAPTSSLSLYVAASPSSPNDTGAGTITALNARTGTQHWKVHPAGHGLLDLVAVNNGLLYLTVSFSTSSFPYLAALNTADGSLRWSYQPRGEPDLLALDQGILYGTSRVSTTDPTLPAEVFALNADTGQVLWETPLQGVGGQGILAKGTLYVASIAYSTAATDTYLYGLDAITGAVHWQQLVPQKVARLEGISGDTLYVDESSPGNGAAVEPLSVRESSLESEPPVGLFALDARTGAERWHQTASFIVGMTSLGVVVERYQDDFGNNALFLTELRRSDGAAIWRVLATSFSTPVLDSGVLYSVLADQVVAAFSANDGSRLWQSRALPDQTSSSVLTVSTSTVYAATYSSFMVEVGLFAFHTPDGKLLWHDTPGVAVIAVQNGTLYGRAPNALVALDASTGAVYWQDTSVFEDTLGVGSVVLG